MRAPQNHYKILKIDASASQAEVKSAYYKQSMKHHPDKNPDNAEAEKEFAKVTEAYTVLSQPHLRSAFDKTMQGFQNPVVSGRMRNHRRGSVMDNRTDKYNLKQWQDEHYGKALKRERARRAEQHAQKAKMHENNDSGWGAIGFALVATWVAAHLARGGF